MKIPISWLNDYIDLDITVEELAYRLTMAGLEVDRITYIGIPANEIDPSKQIASNAGEQLVWERDKIVVGYITEVRPHPDADRLVLAMVEHGEEEPEQVVTGAPNLFDYAGQTLDPPLPVVMARKGAELLDPYSEEWPHDRMTLKPRKLRGIKNSCMVCSEKEVGLSETHEGIMVLDTDATPGTPLQDVLGDAVIELELTPNMARAFSVLGVAREASALTGQPLKVPPTDVTMTGETIDGQVSLEIREPELNPRFTLALLKGVSIEPSPGWLQRRLKLAGMRPVNNIVDITNYIMLETGQPLHAFDYDILRERAGGDAPTIITRLPEEGERLTTLDDIERELDPFTILVADTAGALSLGGVMGGTESEIHDGTVNVLLEAAAWNYINIRQTLSAQRERGKPIASEAGARFSRGVHPEQARHALLRAIAMMRQIAGGTIAEGIVEEYPAPPDDIVVDLPMSEIERLLGVYISMEEVASILTRLEFDIEEAGEETLRVTVPKHRLDIQQIHELENADIADVVAQADLIEEVARIHGYDNIPTTMLVDELPPQRANEPLQQEELVRDVLVGLGLQEVITYRMTTPDYEQRLVPPGVEADLPDAQYIALANPISTERTVMRHTMMNSMLDIMARNARTRDRLALFEIGKVYLGRDGGLPDEPWRVCIGLMGYRVTASWHGDVGDEMMTFYDLKGVIEGLMQGIHAEGVSYEPAEHSSFFPGRAAHLLVAGEPAGIFGQVHPLVVRAYELPDRPVLMADLNLDVLRQALRVNYPTSPISTFPAVYEDIAVIVDDALPAAQVEAVIRKAGGDLLKRVRLFDVYTGEPIPEGKRSLAYALTYRAADRTLQDKDVTKVRRAIIDALRDQLGATLRE